MNVYSGCQNTFVICDYKDELNSSNKAKEYCKDIYDGFILVKCDPLEMIIYNRDGSIANMCGNGIRAFIHYCYDKKLINNDFNKVITKSGIINTYIINKNPFMVKVIMNNNYFYEEPNYWPYVTKINNHQYQIYLVNTGVLHGIIICKNLEEAISDAEMLFNDSFLKRNVNLDFVVLNKNIYVKTYERGVGFTKACGTGNVATYLVLKKLGLIEENEVTIKNDGGLIVVGSTKEDTYLIASSIKEN